MRVSYVVWVVLALAAFLAVALVIQAALPGSSRISRLTPRYDPNIDYGAVPAGSHIQLDVDAKIVDAFGKPVAGATGLPDGAVIGWYVRHWDAERDRQGEADSAVKAGPEAPLERVEGRAGSVIYAPPRDLRGLVVVRAVVASRFCHGDAGDGAAARWDGPCSAEFVMVITPPPPLTLTVFRGSAEGEFLLEWTAGPQPATRWQYRHRGPIWLGKRWRLEGSELVELPDEWDRWRDIPGSDAHTRRHRVSVLGVLGPEWSKHYFQVRPWTPAGVPGNPSPSTYEHFQMVAPDGLAYGDHMMLEAGATFHIGGGGWTFTVPPGMRLRGNGWSQALHTPQAVVLVDVLTRSSLFIGVCTGREDWRYIIEPTGEPVDGLAAGAPRREVHALFDQILDSVRPRAHPPTQYECPE